MCYEISDAKSVLKLFWNKLCEDSILYRIVYKVGDAHLKANGKISFCTTYLKMCALGRRCTANINEPSSNFVGDDRRLDSRISHD